MPLSEKEISIFKEMIELADKIKKQPNYKELMKENPKLRKEILFTEELKALPEISGVKMHIGLEPDEAAALTKSFQQFRKKYEKVLKPKKTPSHFKKLHQKLQSLLEEPKREKKASLDLASKIAKKFLL